VSADTPLASAHAGVSGDMAIAFMSAFMSDRGGYGTTDRAAPPSSALEAEGQRRGKDPCRHHQSIDVPVDLPGNGAPAVLNGINNRAQIVGKTSDVDGVGFDALVGDRDGGFRRFDYPASWRQRPPS
jgi:hypothetical protein